jgi:alkylhydroperoxidase family enzyme
MYDEDVADDGFVWNLTRVWAYQPETQQGLFSLMGDAISPSGLSTRQRGILVAATASTLGDSYCSLAWGGKLAKRTDPATAAGVLTGTDAGLTAQEAAMAAWARLVADDSNSTTPADVERLRSAGFDDAQIFAITAFVALRIAFATVNDALGARPDAELVATLAAEVRAAVDYGRRPLGA